VLEEVLRAERLPFQIIGGVRFFERAEVKDMLSYLRVMSNPRSDVDLAAHHQRALAQDRTDHHRQADPDGGRESIPLFDAIEPLVSGGGRDRGEEGAPLLPRPAQSLMTEARPAAPSEVASKSWTERLPEDAGARGLARRTRASST
jgi:DNA helicase-2/ATP-dependent DNA helicase PcrA